MSAAVAGCFEGCIFHAGFCGEGAGSSFLCEGEMSSELSTIIILIVVYEIVRGGRDCSRILGGGPRHVCQCKEKTRTCLIQTGASFSLHSNSAPHHTEHTSPCRLAGVLPRLLPQVRSANAQRCASGRDAGCSCQRSPSCLRLLQRLLWPEL